MDEGGGCRGVVADEHDDREASTDGRAVTPGNEGLASVGVLKSVLTSWEERIGAVKDECGSPAPNLRLVARD
ncbi:hypothetical protein GCM10014713_31140 [Streptomyces purpureus]|uniref:Uncharacterized protein n=1 Tax=Streptomyces purpureus TaxID=1951 RepID=A0A918LPW1_9ACTN|nr:hypothetical protein GCM10014713_31140 [Streptomyces purpureus]